MFAQGYISWNRRDLRTFSLVYLEIHGDPLPPLEPPPMVYRLFLPLLHGNWSTFSLLRKGLPGLIPSAHPSPLELKVRGNCYRA